MKVIFGADHEHVFEVYWDEGGEIKNRVLMTDGSTEDHEVQCDFLSDVLRTHGSSYIHYYAVEVDDVRVAFKYLGKAADLVATLPEVSLAEPEPPQTAA